MRDSLIPDALPKLVQVVTEVALADGRLVLNDLARRTGCRTRFLEPFLQRLTQDRILHGVRGPDGGYVLGRSVEQINVGDIYRSMMRYRAYVAGLDRIDNNWPLSDTLGCLVVRPALEALDRRIMAELDAVTIADLVRPLLERGGGI